jgi:Recombinase
MAADGFSASDIANHLNAKRKATFTGNTYWRRHQVQWILSSEAVLGIFVPGHYVEDRTRRKGRRRVCDTEGVEGYYPPIISEDLWRRARRVVEDHSQSGRGRKGAALTNLVSGLGYCEVCGSKLHYGNGYLRCSLSIQRRACTNNIGFPYAKLEALLMTVGHLPESVANLMPQPTQTNTAQQIVAELDAEIGRKSEAMVQMVRDYASKTGAQAQAAMTVQDELNADITRLKQRLVEARDKLGHNGPDEREGFFARLDAARALLNSDDPRERRDSRIRLSQDFHRLIEGIVLHPAKTRSPDRFVTVHLKPDSHGLRLIYAFSPQTVAGINGQTLDGRRQMPCIFQASDDDGDLSKTKLVARALNVKITHDGSGRYRGIAAEQDPGPIVTFSVTAGRIVSPGMATDLRSPTRRRRPGPRPS